MTRHNLEVFRVRDPNGKRHWLVTDGKDRSVNGRTSWNMQRTVTEWQRRFADPDDGLEYRRPASAHTLGEVLRLVGPYTPPPAAVSAAPEPAAPAEPVERQHVSHSQLTMYCRCGEQYRRRYLEREVLAPGVALLRGKSFHQAVAHNFKQKVDSHSDLPMSDVIDFGVWAFDASVDKDGVALSDEEQGQPLSLTLAKGRQATANLLGAHMTVQAPDYQPVLVEKEISIPMPQSSRDLLGVVDLLDDRHRVVDFKTSSRKMNQGDVDATTQLTVYAATVTYLTGKAPSALCYDVLVDKAVPERQVVTTTRDREDVVALSRRIETVVAAIDKGVFPPALPDSWWCSPKWCGYHATCPYVRARRSST